MLGQQAVPDNEGQISSFQKKLHYEVMLNNVSKLVNLRNAKKLAQNGASQMDSPKCLSSLSKVVPQNLSGELQNSPTRKSPHVPREGFGSNRSKTDKTDVKARARASECQSSQTISDVESMTSHSPRELSFGSESSRTHETDVKMRTGANEGQSSQTTCEVGRLSRQSPNASLALLYGSGQRKIDRTQAKINMMTNEEPQSGSLDLNVLLETDSCPSIKTSNTNISQNTLMMPMIGCDGSYSEATGN